MKQRRGLSDANETSPAYLARSRATLPPIREPMLPDMTRSSRSRSAPQTKKTVDLSTLFEKHRVPKLGALRRRQILLNQVKRDTTRGRRSRVAPPAKRTLSIQTFFESDCANGSAARRIRICVVDPGLQVGGAEWFTTLLIQLSNPQMYEFVVLSYRPEETGLQKYTESLGVKVISAVSLFGRGLTFKQWIEDKLWTVLELQRPDILYFSSNYLYERISAASPDRLASYQVLVRISNFKAAELDCVNFSSATRIICCSDEQYAHMSKSNPGKAVLLKTGVDVQQFSPVKSQEKLALRKELGLPEKTVVLFSGRLGDPLKRTWLFQNVVDQVLSQREDVAFLVLGYFESHRKSDEEAFRQFVNKRGIIWKDNVQPWEISKYFQAADVLLSVSDKGEGLSNTVLQGLATGVVSVVTPASGMSELIETGKNGFILENEDPVKIAEILSQVADLNQQSLKSISANARNRAKTHYNIRDSVHSYERLFYETYKAMPARVTLVDGSWGIGGAEWLAALLCLSCDSSKLEFNILSQSGGSELVKWLAQQGVTVSAPSAGMTYSTWSEDWMPKSFRSIRPHVVMPCTSTTWELSTGNHRLLGISQNASDAGVLRRSHYDRVAYLICVSEEVRSVLDQAYRFKMTVLRNSIDVEMFRRNETIRREVRREIGCDDKRIVLWCGRLSEPRKRLDILCEVIEKCSDQPELHFAVLGYFKGHDEQKLKWQRFLDLHPNVTWISGVRHWEAPLYYSAADFYLSTSGYTDGDFEGLSVASVQALAAGLPIVTTLSGGQREVVTDDVNGFLTPTGDAETLSLRLKTLCDLKPQMLNEIRQRNVEKASAEFDIRRHSRLYETICWTLKNTIDAALPYDPSADTELLKFDDSDRLSVEQQHQASFFVNHISPLLIDNSRKLFTAEGAVEDASAERLPPGGNADHFLSSTEPDIRLLQTLAEDAVAPILEVGSLLNGTAALMARSTRQPVYVYDVKSRVPTGIAIGNSLVQAESAEKGMKGVPGIIDEVSERYLRITDDTKGIQRITSKPLTRDGLASLGIVVLDESLTFQELTEGLMLAGETVLRGGCVVLRGCNSPDVDSPARADRRLLGTPASALLSYMQTHFPLWGQPYQIGSSVVLRKRP
jgi:glycosyltransferase involved in cell wall biosynthesis